MYKVSVQAQNIREINLIHLDTIIFRSVIFFGHMGLACLDQLSCNFMSTLSESIKQVHGIYRYIKFILDYSVRPWQLAEQIHTQSTGTR